MSAREANETQIKIPKVSWRMEIRRLKWIVRHVEKLSPTGILWLRSWLNEDFTEYGLQRVRPSEEPNQ
jgi:hypothetical protein